MIKFLEKLDAIWNNIPYRVRTLIQVLVISVWLLVTIYFAIDSFLRGLKKAPVVGEDPVKKELEEKIQSNQNKKRTVSIILPDLNDLVKEEAPLQVETDTFPAPAGVEASGQDRTNILRLFQQDDTLLMPEKQNPLTRKGDFSFEEFPAPSRSQNTSGKEKKLELIEIEN